MKTAQEIINHLDEEIKNIDKEIEHKNQEIRHNPENSNTSLKDEIEKLFSKRETLSTVLRFANI